MIGVWHPITIQLIHDFVFLQELTKSRFFDFQHLADEAFKDFKNMRLKRKLKADDYLALSIQTVANPFHMGKPELLKALFPCSGWN